MRRLSPPDLPSTRFGGPRMTMAMIHASWHLTTVAFLTTAVALLASGSVLDGDMARGVARVAAAGATGFAAVVLVLGVADTGSPRSILRHPGPIMLTLVAVLACWGAF